MSKYRLRNGGHLVPRGRWVKSDSLQTCVKRLFHMRHRWSLPWETVCTMTLDSDLAWWRHQMENFPRYWPFVRGVNRSPVNSPHNGQWHRALIFSLICAWINGWVNNGEAGDLRRHRAHYDVTVMNFFSLQLIMLKYCTTCHVRSITYASLDGFFSYFALAQMIFSMRGYSVCSEFYSCGLMCVLGVCIGRWGGGGVEMWGWVHNQNILGVVSIRKTVLPGVAIPMLKIRRPNGRLIFNIGIAIPR